MVSWRICNKLASLSLLFVVKKAICNWSEILDSASNRTNVGLDKPALAKSTNDAGSVAENKSVCLEVGKDASNSLSCSAKPNSNNASASSKTMYSTDLKSRSISIFKCINLPGVAITISGLDVIAANWSSIESPPIKTMERKSVLAANSFTCLYVCVANSADGDKMTAAAPTLAE